MRSLGRIRAGFGRAAEALAAHFDVVIVALLFGLFAVVEHRGGHPERIPVLALYCGTWVLNFALPATLVWWHKRRQQHVITKVRSLYAVAVEYLMAGRDHEARRALRSIRRWEQHWRIGNSAPYRLAYSAVVIGATSIVAAVHYVCYFAADTQWRYGQAHKTIADTLNHLFEQPFLFWFIGGMGLLFGFGAARYLKDLAGISWSEFYGDRLEAALKAGRTINEAPWHDTSLPEDALSARELLGLPARFTRAQLRRAWLDLVRELHPDRWAAAGDSVRLMKEAALKRVNAARDELAAQAAD